MKKLILFFFCLSATLTFAQYGPIGTGTQIVSPIVPQDTISAANATHYSNWAVGGLHNVTRYTQMDSIYTVITNSNQETEGTLCWVEDSTRYYYYTGSVWTELSIGKWLVSGDTLYYNAGNVGIGTATPSEKLDVVGNAKITGKLFINQDSDGNGIYVDSEGTSKYGGLFEGKYGVKIEQNLVDGRGLYILRNDFISLGTYSLVTIQNNGAGNLQAILELSNAGSGAHIITTTTNEDLEINPNGTGILDIDGGISLKPGDTLFFDDRGHTGIAQVTNDTLYIFAGGQNAFRITDTDITPLLPLNVGALEGVKNTDGVLIDKTVDTDAVDGTVVGFTTRIDANNIFSVRALSQGAGSVDSARVDFTASTDNDFIMNFIGTTNSGSITYMEDEDRFDVDCDITADNLGLVLITENAQTGWRLYGYNPANYGDIGIKAIDLSYSGGASATQGATGNYSYAEGNSTIASGDVSHAEGNGSVASATASHAEGSSTASGTNSHAEGGSTTASGIASHAEGDGTIASRAAAHSQGYETTASGSYSHVGGAGYDDSNRPDASGLASFNHQEVENGQGIKESLGANSAILGGKNNETTITALNSVSLGGEGQSVTEPNTVKVPHLQIDSTGTFSGDVDIAGKLTTSQEFIWQIIPATADIDGAKSGAASISGGVDADWKISFDNIPTKWFGSNVVLDSILITIETTVAAAFVNNIWLQRSDYDNTGTSVVTYVTDVGSGTTTTEDVNILASDFTMGDYVYWILFDPDHNAAANEIFVHAIRAYAHLE
ncbi:MAG: hypothetical protein ISS18_15130 [Bacteroidales bacterium]|nr:hypothetical protein [Bacteroidales bacterium]